MRIKVSRLGINGEGVANLVGGDSDGKVCFVEGALPGEEIDAVIIKDKKKYCVGKISDIISQSPHRVEPPCPFFGNCGGCDIQHIDKQLQLMLKKDNIGDSIRKIGGINVDVDDPIRLNDYGYRNKMVFPYVYRNGRNILGMFAKNSHNVIDIDSCLLADDDLNKFLKISKEYLSKSIYSGYDYSTRTGDIKYLVARVHENNILVTIVATRKLALEDYYNTLINDYDGVGLSLVISNSDDEIMSGRYIHLYGNKYLELDEFGIKYKIDNRGFLQVNNEIKHYLYSHILDNIDKDDVVIDAYSGAGLLSAIVSQKCKRVIGIEINESASSSAKRLAIDNALSNVTYITGDVKEHIEDYLIDNEKYVVILDPPRAGCDESVLQLLGDINVKNNPKNSLKSNVCKVHRIIYISCNPATLSRDLKILSQGYNITSVTPLEMFPQTKHVETLVVMENKIDN